MPDPSASAGPNDLARGETSATRPPNIVIVLADDLGYETLGVYGGVSYRTPNLDALARSGMRFDRAYAHPLCTPSRVALLTGKHNLRNYREFGHLARGETTFAHWLRRYGYRTMVSGKWQLAGRDALGRPGQGPAEAGFDEYSVTEYKTPTASIYWDPQIHRNEVTTTYPGAFGPDIFLKDSLEFIEDNRDRPFLLYFASVLPHGPFTSTPDRPHVKTVPGQFRAMVEYLDKNIGALVTRLEQLGIRENTLIVFLGDNGTDTRVYSRMADGRVVRGGKGSTQDAGIHVPWIASWPTHISANSTHARPVDLTTLLPTLIDIAGGIPPADTDGYSLWPELRGLSAQHRDWVYIYFHPRKPGIPSLPVAFALDGRYKLYDSPRYFYDTWKDPEELRRLTAGSLVPSERRARARLDSVLGLLSPTPNNL